MIIVLKKGCKKKSVESVIKKVKDLGFSAHAILVWKERSSGCGG